MPSGSRPCNSSGIPNVKLISCALPRSTEGIFSIGITANLPANLLEEVNKRIPLERWGTVEDVAYAVAFLASDSAKFITGQRISVNGGNTVG